MRNRATALLFVFSLPATVVVSRAADSADWPMYLADLAHTSYRPGETRIDSTNIAQLQQLWKTSFGATISTGVTTAGGFLYFGDWKGNFHAIDARSGAPVWSQFLGVAPAVEGCSPAIGVAAQPVVSAQTVYAAGGDSAVYALDTATGQIQWRVSLADPATGSFLWSSLVLYQNAIYIGIASLSDCPLVRGGLARIPLDDPTHPQIAYFTSADVTGASIWSTPAIDTQANLIYVTTGNTTGNIQDAGQGIWGSTLLALDATTLEIRSHFFMPFAPEDNDPDWGSSPILFEAGGDSLVAANGKDGVMYVLHRPDLSLVWSYKLARDCDSPTLGCGSTSTPSFDGNFLITGGGQPDGTNTPPGTVYAFDAAGQQLMWTYAANGPVLAPVTLTPGLAFVASTRGLSVLDSSNGAELWNDSGAGELFSQPVVSNGVLYATYTSGDVVAWAPGGTLDDSTPLLASPASLKIPYTAGGPPPGAQSTSVSAAAGSVAISVTSDSPWLTASLSSPNTPATLSVQATPFAGDPGTYDAHVTVSAAGSSVTILVTLVINPPPTLDTASLLNAASFQPGIAPGGLVSLFAANLSAETMSSDGSTPTAWDGISLKINGISMPLMFVSPTQINAQVPWETPSGPAQLTLESNGLISQPVTVTVIPAAPGIFTDADGHAAALNQDFTLNSAGNPAPGGSYLSIYLTGQGTVDPPAVTGTVASVVSNTVAPTSATIDGVPAPVAFSGLAPGFTGLGQVNLLIPDLPPGEHVLVVTIGDSQSNPVKISTTL